MWHSRSSTLPLLSILYIPHSSHRLSFSFFYPVLSPHSVVILDRTAAITEEENILLTNNIMHSKSEDMRPPSPTNEDEEADPVETPVSEVSVDASSVSGTE